LLFKNRRGGKGEGKLSNRGRGDSIKIVYKGKERAGGRGYCAVIQAHGSNKDRFNHTSFPFETKKKKNTSKRK